MQGMTFSHPSKLPVLIKLSCLRNFYRYRLNINKALKIRLLLLLATINV